MIIQDIKKYKHYAKIVIEESYNIENSVMIKYDIKVGSNFSKKELETILEESELLYFDRIGKNKLTRLLTTHELIEYFKKLKASEKTIQILIDKFTKLNYLNDDYYTERYIETRIIRNGPKQIERKLKEKGIKISIIKKHLENVDEETSIKNIVLNYLSKEQKRSKKETENYLIRHLTNKGYNYNIVNNIVKENIDNYKGNELKLIEKEYYKLYYKNKTKKEENELMYYIKNKLYQKGFKIDDINNFLGNM